jgi:hypothetical protein
MDLAVLVVEACGLGDSVSFELSILQTDTSLAARRLAARWLTAAGSPFNSALSRRPFR